MAKAATSQASWIELVSMFSLKLLRAPQYYYIRSSKQQLATFVAWVVRLFKRHSLEVLFIASGVSDCAQKWVENVSFS